MLYSVQLFVSFCFFVMCAIANYHCGCCFFQPSSRFDELPDDFDPSGRLPGSFDDGDPQTTNLYVGNLSPQVSFLL